jgi:hypothetical protein
MRDPCAFDNERLVRPEPFELRYYDVFDYRQVSCTLDEFQQDHGFIPEPKRVLVDRVKNSIAKDGMRNPLIIEWFTQDPSLPLRWLSTIGNNRYMALQELGVAAVPALVIFPTSVTGVPELSGDYETLDFMSALALFDASHPWWNSAALRGFCPSLVPRCI